MDIRSLQSFLAITREGSITAAARSLHLSQPALSAQMKQLEQELGTALFLRGSKGARHPALTEEGLLLRKRAEEILSLVEKTESELAQSRHTLSGQVRIGAAESDAMTLIAQTAQALQARCPGVRFDIFSSNRAAVLEQLDRGLVDFGIVYGDVDPLRFESALLPHRDRWVAVMRRDAPLARKEAVTPADLTGQKLIFSRNQDALLTWLGQRREELNVTATCNLIYNIAILVRAGFGYALTLVEPLNAPDLCCRPLEPPLEARLRLVWRRQAVFSGASRQFLKELLEALET